MGPAVAKPEGAERRVWPRVHLNAEAILRFDSVDGQMRSRILNASGNGLLLAVPNRRPIGTPMGITVFVRSPPRQIRVMGVIVHVKERNSLYEDQLPISLGIYLTQAGDDWLDLCDEVAM